MISELGLDLVLAAMKAHPDAANVQKAACGVLANLAANCMR